MTDAWERELNDALDFCDWEQVGAILTSSPVRFVAHLDQMKAEFDEGES